MKAEFNKTIAKQIADKNFSHTLDCIMGYSDAGYSLKDDADTFEQNFAEDLEEMGILVNDRRLKIISDCYANSVKNFEKLIRKKYYDK